MSLVGVSEIIVLGIVEGFAEWLPTSNTGHVIPMDEIIHLNQPDASKDVFLVAIQLGTILAVVVMYFHKLNLFSPAKTNRQKDTIWALWIKITIARVPAAILGLLLDDWMETHLLDACVVAAALIVYGILFIVLENNNVCTNPKFIKAGQISAKIALLIGMVQLLALMLGTSRFSSTTLGAMALGCSRVTMAEFSFFLEIPVMFGASLLKTVKHFLAGDAFTGPQIFYTTLGMLIAFVVSIYSIRFLISYVYKHDFKFFGYYRIILDVVVSAHFGVAALASQE